jgi:hypothetical protein
MQNFGAVKAVKFRRRGDAVCPYIFRVQAIADFQITRELFRQRNFVEAVAGGADNGTDLFYPAFE